MSDYNVGYGKPPKEGRFVKGESGNPKGRRKGSKNMATIFKQVTEAKVTVKENGRSRAITRIEAVIHQLTSKAISGDIRAMAQLIQLSIAFEASVQAVGTKPEVGERERAAFQNILKRVKRIAQTENDIDSND